jgi:hypothetical protein
LIDYALWLVGRMRREKGRMKMIESDDGEDNEEEEDEEEEKQHGNEEDGAVFA